MYSEIAYISLSRGQHWQRVGGAGLGGAEWSVFLQDYPPVITLEGTEQSRVEQSRTESVARK